MVADELKVDPVALHNGSNDMLDSVGGAALSFVNHEDGLADAAPGWIGSRSRRWVSWRPGGKRATTTTNCRWADWGRMWPTQ